MKRVGIFAGSFDPVHEGHVAFAKQALITSRLDKVFFLVEPRPRRKQGVRALEHRLAMVQLAIKGESKLGSIMIEQARFSVAETLPVLKELFKGAELHLLFGDDVLKHLAHWPHVEQLAHGVYFAIGVRGESLEPTKTELKALETALHTKLHYDLFISTAPALSSTKIRLSLKRGHVPHGLTPDVLTYIQNKGLYSSTRS